MLAAFEGWNDAGSAASTAVAQLAAEWESEEAHRMDVDSFHDFQVNRPMISTDEEGNRVLVWPETTVSVASSPLRGRRVVVVEGAEPSMRWREYCRQLLDIAEDLGVATIVCVGALLADVPHTRPIPVQTSSDDPSVQALLDVDASDYEGPSGITGVLTYVAMQRHFHSVNVWAAVPHYVAQPPSPKATLALLTALEELLGEPVPMRELPEDAKAWQDGVDELASEDPEVAEYVQQLEQAKDTAELPEASGDAIAKEFEKYLRRRDWGT